MKIFVSQWQLQGSVLCCSAAALPWVSRMGVLVWGGISILSIVSTASSGVSRAVNSKDETKPSQSPPSMEGLHEGSALHTPVPGISTSFCLGIQHSLPCARTPRAEPLGVGDAGREGVRQEAQDPIPAVTQNCREISNVPTATLTPSGVTPARIHAWILFPSMQEGADEPQAHS